MLRRDDDSILRVTLDFEVSDNRKRERPKKTWKKQVEEETEKTGLKKENALIRDKWGDEVQAIAEGMGPIRPSLLRGQHRTKTKLLLLDDLFLQYFNILQCAGSICILFLLFGGNSCNTSYKLCNSKNVI